MGFVGDRETEKEWNKHERKREHSERTASLKRGQRENDKGERGVRFDWKGRQRGLFPFTSVFSVLCSVLSVVPMHVRSALHTNARTSTTHVYSTVYTCVIYSVRRNIHSPEFSFFSFFLFFLRSLRPSRFIPSFSICYIYSYLLLFPYVLNTFDVYTALSVRLSASSSLSLSLFYHLNYYTRFHVMWLYAFAVRGQLYTWVNGKMSFETFLGRSRSPHCQSYTRDSAWGS